MKKSKSSRETESDKEPTLTAKERYTRWVTHLTFHSETAFEAVLFKTEVLQSILNASLVEGNRMMQAEAGLLHHFQMYRG